MGDKRGGEGGGQGPTPEDLAAAIAADCFEAGVEVGHVKVQRVTQGVYMVEVYEHGIHTPESFFYSQPSAPPPGVPE